LTLEEREAFWNSAYDSWGGDFEEDVVENHTSWLYGPVICSYHNFNEVPDNLFEIYERIISHPNANIDVVKIAVQTSDITDSIPIWKLLERAKSENKQIIPIAMGESGKWTRILGLAHGAFMTYAALDSGQETATGQVSAKDLTEIYRVKELDETTEVYGILGSNTSVSMSPYIHNAAFKYHGLNAVFVPLQVNDLDEFMRRMIKPETREIELNFKGFSVTIPHKQSIIKHLDFLDETAAEIGAVNTVRIVDGKLHGYNTDARGFLEPLLNSYGDLTNAKVAVLGAGGAARAVVYALKNAGAKVTIFARDLAKAKSLAEDFQVEFEELSKSKDQKPKTDFSNFDILVNATPLGMKGKGDGETPVFAEQLKGLHLVYDLVYVPFQSPLMAEADLAEVPKIGGLAMLIAQAIAQQKIWTNLDAPMKEMSRAALKRLQ
jgi:3-dehydroquinate dehydratase/shikimate dehydrogenase